MEILKKILSLLIYEAVKSFDGIYEIRMRVNEPLTLNVKNKYVCVGVNGIAQRKDAITVTKSTLESVVLNACNRSVYAYSEQIKRGYINVGQGVRIGLCGETVMENGRVISVKNPVALNIRIPHAVKGCCKPLLRYLEPLKSVLIVSPCGCGKTTFLRDLAMELGSSSRVDNIMIIDERGELAGVTEGESLFHIPKADVLTNCDKKTAIENALRTMNPDILVTDELFLHDMDNINVCANGGVKVFASIHAASFEELDRRISTEALNKIFELYVFLSKRKGAGTFEGVFDRNGKRLDAN
ncbi:MAG: ATPase, T2SS/T4P/T4SS family [Clostridia bacterium]|nr:ATPase, T2SS/T4P/T4SS family [Clostridia bacterium]